MSPTILSRRVGSSGGSGGGGVTSIKKVGSSSLTGAVTLSDGAGIDLTQAAQNIEIASNLGFFNVLDYGAVGNGTTDDSGAFQDAIDAASAANGGFVWFPSDTYKFTTTLQLKSGVTLFSSGLSVGGGAILNYAGADGTHGIENHAVSNSALGIVGLRLDDTRTAPTSGDMIHLTTTNGSRIENTYARSKSGAGIYIGNTSGTPDNYVVRSVWAVGATYGLIADHVAENCILEDIKGDSSPTYPFDSLILLKGNAGTGFSNHVILGAKVEIQGGGPTANVLRIDSTFNGSVTASGLHLGTGGGYIVRNDSSTVVAVIETSGTVGSLGLINDTVASVVYGDGTNERRIGHFVLNKVTSIPANSVTGASARGVTTRSSADLNLDGTHDVVLFSTGNSDRSAFLPRTSVSPGRLCTIKKIDTGTGHVVINPNATVLEAIGTPVERYAAQYGTNQGATSTLSPTGTVAAGNTLFLFSTCASSKLISSIADDAGNTWTVTDTVDNGGQTASMAFSRLTTQLTTGSVITITWAVATANQPDVWMYEVSGLAVSASDTGTTGTGSSTSPSAGPTSTLAQVNEIVWGLFRNSATAAFTKGSGYTASTTSSPSLKSGLEWKKVTATTAVTANGTWASTGTWGGIVRAFKGVATTVPAQVESASTLTLTSTGDKASVVYDGSNWWSI